VKEGDHELEQAAQQQAAAVQVDASERDAAKQV